MNLFNIIGSIFANLFNGIDSTDQDSSCQGNGALNRGSWNDFNNIILGNSANNLLNGGRGNDIIYGFKGDDTLMGDLGSDTMYGGAGNDLYEVDNANDVVAENSNEGLDTVQSRIAWTLGANLENLILVGNNAISGTGNKLNNQITGNSANNTLDGASGSDTLLGGLGNDLYVVDNAGDVVQEYLNEGIDTVQSSVAYTLSANVENLLLTGSSALNGTGNDLDNVITGNSGKNNLVGGSGNDTLIGGAGNDTLNGGINNDTYVFASGFGIDSLVDAQGVDTLDFANLSKAVNFDAYRPSVTVGSDSANWNINTTRFENIFTGSGNDYVHTGDEDNWLKGGAGNDYLDAATGNDMLEGGIGNDTLNGDAGNDVYVFNVGFGTDSLMDVMGVDTLDFTSLSTSVNFDAYKPLITAGSDSVSWNIGTTRFENIFTGSGNDYIHTADEDNWLKGGAGNDYLDAATGNDTLEGGIGNDTLNGDTGNDVYVFSDGFGTDSLMDVLGVDTLDFTSLSKAVNFDAYKPLITAGSDSANWNINTTRFENIFTGSGNDYIHTGDEDNWLKGGAGNDYLDAATGNDMLEGGIGNDILLGDAGDDTYVFNLGDGQDIVNDSAGQDILRFGNSVSQGNVAVFQAGNGDLQLGYTNSSGDLITIQSQSTSNNAIERFELSNGYYMNAADVNAVINQMAAYAVSEGITVTSLSDVESNAGLMNLVNSGWHT